MGDVQEIDVERIMEWLREDIKKRRPEHSLENKTTRFPDEELAADFASFHATYDVHNLQFTSHRRVLGLLVIFVKRLLQQLLTPILTRQVTYNAVNTRVATRLGEKLAALNHQAQMQEGFLTSEGQAMQAVQAQLTAFEQRLRRHEDGLTAHAEAMQEYLDKRIENLDGQQKIGLQSMRERVSRAERKLRRVLYVLTDDQMAGERLKIERKAVP